MSKWFSRLTTKMQNRRRSTELPAPRVVVYTRARCCLCGEVLEVLERYGLVPEIIDIDVQGQEALQSLYTNCVPVVEIDGKVRFRGRISEVLLKRLLAARG